MFRENLLRITVRTVITQHSSNCQSLFQRNLVNSILELYIIEIFDIHYVIAMQLRSNIHGLRIGSTSYQAIVASNLLLIALLVTLSRQSVNVSNIYMGSTNATMGNLLGFSHDSINPSHVISNKLRCAAGMSLNIFREKRRNITSAGLGKAANSIMLKIVFFHIDFHSSLKRPNSAGLSQFQDLGLSLMRKDIFIVLLLGVKYIMFHSFVSSFRIVIVVIIGLSIFAKSLSDQCIGCCLLFFSHRIKNILDRFLFSLILRIIVIIGRMINHDVLIVSNDKLIFGILPMSHNRVDKSSGIGTGENQTQFINNSVYHIRPGLF